MTTENLTICGIKDYEKKNIFKIIRLDRLKNNTCSYVFIGEQPRDVKQSLSNLELTGKSDGLLKSHFKQYYDIITKHKTQRFKFIYQHIYEDDTITTIRKKIFCFMSNNKDILLPKNQELWIIYGSGTKILGPTWTNIEGRPSLLQKEIVPDYKNFVAKDGHTILVEHAVNINDQTLYDATNGIRFENGEIYLHMLNDEMEYCRSIGKKVNDILVNGYFIKYWAGALIEYDPDIIYKEMERLKPLIKAEDK